MKDLLFIAVGGALGAVSRYGVALATSRFWGTAFPWGTLLVNVGGCFLLGILIPVGLAGQWLSTEWQRGLGVGFLGALTTFSTFGVETWTAWEAGNRTVALANIGANLILGLTAAALGMALGERLA